MENTGRISKPKLDLIPLAEKRILIWYVIIEKLSGGKVGCHGLKISFRRDCFVKKKWTNKTHFHIYHKRNLKYCKTFEVQMFLGESEMNEWYGDRDIGEKCVLGGDGEMEE